MDNVFFCFRKFSFFFMVLFVLLVASCGRTEKQTVIKGEITWLLGSKYYTLVSDNGIKYSLRLIPSYKYIDRTGKYPPSSEGKIEILCLGRDGLYRCEGMKRTIQQVIDEARKTKSRLIYPDCDYFFDVYKIELLEARGE